jgi:hypothetical protein
MDCSACPARAPIEFLLKAGHPFLMKQALGRVEASRAGGMNAVFVLVEQELQAVHGPVGEIGQFQVRRHRLGGAE